ncbi:3-carboxy-cis,cis-muconate cycloisomerase [Paracoccus solventivorans]|uniref:3-carboxy-cis,cis-muconate cycloisomerase n=1 Tax=Paracoccus solventivorans TaxID=53463 RepID=A0A1M7JJ00_9RHOB|nr:lyase family protein [Paracoccus solventivorans]SHM52871.1 3-carboxy-cis,cis-muconate cycloisomerase [Paracoccus solventivorans]
MTTGTLLGQLYGDAEMAAILSDRSAIAAMLRVEVALARAQADLGVIPAAAAEAIAQAAAALDPDPAELSAAVAVAGIPAQPVIAALKSAAGEAGGFAHYGATSQDIQDTALALQLVQALDLLDARLGQLAALLAQKAADHAELPIPARTRHQLAAPTTLGAKIAVWQGMAVRNRQRLAQLRPRLLLLSLHGAAGTEAAFSGHGPALRAAMAAALGLGVPGGPWHAARDGIAELAGWLSLVTGALGKMGLDLIQLGQSEIAEVSAGDAGGSSTMPQKQNPVAAEALVTLARLNAGDLAGMHQALLHAQERDGSALGLEWTLLPAMLERTAAALRIGCALAATLAPRPDRIAASFAADRGRMAAEAAGFLLARTMPRERALAIVAQALAQLDDGKAATLAEALAHLAPGRDWARALRPENLTGAAPDQARAATPD